MLQGNKKIVILAIFFILALVFTLQVRSTLDANKQVSTTSQNIEVLKAQLSDEEDRINYYSALIDENEKKKEAYLKANVEDRNDEVAKALKQELDSIRVMAGLTDVRGSGVVIKLDDANIGRNEMIFDSNDYIIHDIDVVKVLNTLKEAGAQAISINGERIIATSEQVCAGPTIRINNSRYAVPYEIHAIGDPDLLYESVSSSDAVALMLAFRIRVEIARAPELIIPKYNKNLDYLVSALEVAGI